MTDIELIVGLFTFGGWALTVVKVARKHTRWWWNMFPFICGFTTALWLARIFG